MERNRLTNLVPATVIPCVHYDGWGTPVPGTVRYAPAMHNGSERAGRVVQCGNDRENSTTIRRFEIEQVWQLWLLGLHYILRWYPRIRPGKSF